MAKQKAKSIRDIRSQELRIRNKNAEFVGSKKISSQEYINRLNRVNGIARTYEQNIQNTPSYKRTDAKISNIIANKEGSGYNRMDAIERFDERNQNRKYSRSTYMGGVKRASGSKG